MWDYGVWIGIAATIVVAVIQWQLKKRLDSIDRKIEVKAWESARNAFFANCFILSRDLLRALLAYTHVSDGAVYIRENTERALYELINKSDYLDSQITINLGGLRDEEVAELSQITSNLKFAANFARDSLRSWNIIDDKLPLHREVATAHEEYRVSVDRERFTNRKLHPDVTGKYFESFAKDFASCCDRYEEACEQLSKFTLRHTSNGETIRGLFPPTWMSADAGEELGYRTCQTDIEEGLTELLQIREIMKERGLCLIKYPEEPEQ